MNKVKYWRGVGASEIGPEHVKRGLPNQDAWLFRKYSWGWVGVVADGMGSKQYADHGAKMACLAVAKSVSAFARTPQMHYSKLLEAIHCQWLNLIYPFTAKECATTCLFVLWLKESIMIAQLGDGMIALYDKDKTKSLLFRDKKIDTFSNQTVALGELFSLSAWQFSILPQADYQAIVLMSDGISDDLTLGREMEFVQDLYRAYHYRKKTKSIEQDMKRWLKAWPVPLHSDDKTILFIRKES